MFAAHRLTYAQTKAFSTIVTDYLREAPQLRSFYAEAPTLEGIKATIEKKKTQTLYRDVLTTALKEQYKGRSLRPEVAGNIELLNRETTFTVCTAHQPNLFTGPLYFMYKIIHAIRLAAALKKELPAYDFVPVYYMGSEDADFAELNHTWIDGKKIEWNKVQTGAVGRMVVDASLIRLIDELEGQLIGEAHGAEVIGLLRNAYRLGSSIQSATFDLIDELYGPYGLVVLIPDVPALKSLMITVFEDDIFDNTPSTLVADTSERLGADYKVQAHPREINLFYLKDAVRERIVRTNTGFSVLNTEFQFTAEEMKAELRQHPERFSPNVILRGLYQETILPNIAFVGGGGELAYWLQLCELFERYKTVFPVLVLRNSFLVIESKWKELIQKTGIHIEDLFLATDELLRTLVIRKQGEAVQLNGQLAQAEELYQTLSQRAGAIDPTLARHVAALRARSIRQLEELEKKMIRAEKRKWSVQQGQLQKLRDALFPRNGLQERVENFSLFYAKWGRGFIDELYRHSGALEQEFTVLVKA
jgi:bacillithiol synthase